MSLGERGALRLEAAVAVVTLECPVEARSRSAFDPHRVPTRELVRRSRRDADHVEPARVHRDSHTLRRVALSCLEFDGEYFR